MPLSLRDTEEEAKAVLNEIIAQANVEAVNAFGDATREAGAAALSVRAIGQNRPLMIWFNTMMVLKPI
jgi:hypothetical protein